MSLGWNLTANESGALCHRLARTARTAELNLHGGTVYRPTSRLNFGLLYLLLMHACTPTIRRTPTMDGSGGAAAAHYIHCRATCWLLPVCSSSRVQTVRKWRNKPNTLPKIQHNKSRWLYRSCSPWMISTMLTAKILWKYQMCWQLMSFWPTYPLIFDLKAWWVTFQSEHSNGMKNTHACFWLNKVTKNK